LFSSDRLTQIIEAVDENIDLRRCKGMNACNNGKQCISHQLWCDVSKQIALLAAKSNMAVMA
jgi:Rrf2 family iron-sulfur cluster assembly transcriptional regulator